ECIAFTCKRRVFILRIAHGSVDFILGGSALFLEGFNSSVKCGEGFFVSFFGGALNLRRLFDTNCIS
ncbi:hypothetical protein ACHAXS_003131, partial [Conticribra weissflogii]